MEIADLNSIFGLFGVVILTVYYKIREFVEKNLFAAIIILGLIAGLILTLFLTIKKCTKHFTSKKDKVSKTKGDDIRMKDIIREELVRRIRSKKKKKGNASKRDTGKECVQWTAVDADYIGISEYTMSK